MRLIVTIIVLFLLGTGDDISRKLAGNRWYVGMIARIDILLTDSLLTNQQLSNYSVEEIRNALGELFVSNRNGNATISTSGKKTHCYSA
ncbi:hypothetical protein ACFL0M_06155 [Thermodesulfobacteriota bacterium]